MINLEIKLPVDDLDEIRRRALAAGAVPSGVLQQTDTFFAATRGLLKLRVLGDGSAELIAYERPRTAASRISDYIVCPVSDPARLHEVLSRSHGRLVEVRKTRDLLMLGGTRIHLDRVEGLGTFVELETEGDSRDEAAMRAEHERVIEALGLDRGRFLAGSYAEMLMEKGGGDPGGR